MSSTPYAADLYSSETARDAISVKIRYDALKRTTPTALLLILFFGFLGAHRFYAGRMGSGAAMLVITATSAALFGTPYSVCGFVFVGVWGLIDAYRLPQLIAAYNRSLLISLGH
jgi:TM2 domain-containing membrane protein YozV